LSLTFIFTLIAIDANYNNTILIVSYYVDNCHNIIDYSRQFRPAFLSYPATHSGEYPDTVPAVSGQRPAPHLYNLA